MNLRNLRKLLKAWRFWRGLPLRLRLRLALQSAGAKKGANRRNG